MKVPIAIGKWLTKNGYHNRDSNWRSMGNNMMYMYVMKNGNGYLVTVCQLTCVYFVEILKRHDALEFNRPSMKCFKSNL